MALEKETIGFWEKLMKFKDKHGYWNLTKLVLFVAFSVAILFLAKNFGENYSFERQKEAMTQAIVESEQQMSFEHNEKIEVRQSIKPYIVDILTKTIIDMDADRAFVVELHNGSNNTAGLPFLHCTMTYEETANGYDHIDEDYQNLSLTRFTFSEYLHTHNIWYGTVDDFAKIDQKIAARLKTNGATYMALITIRSSECEIGYFGFTYCNGKQPKPEQEIVDYMVHQVQKLSKWLDNTITQ